MQQCGYCCSFLSGLLRRAMCVGSRRGSSESYYRELGEQDTLKIEDKTSDISEDIVEICQEHQKIVQSPSIDIEVELCRMRKREPCSGRFLTMQKRRKKLLLTRSLYQESALLDDFHAGQVQCILEKADQWKFNAFVLENLSGGRCLPVFCIHLFHVYDLINHFNLDVAKAWKLFSLIEEGYHSTNPYHNSTHAADVTQAMHCFLQQKQIREHVEPLEIMASLIAAMAHDVDHPGVNQQFLIATSNHLATLYKNKSVLENHHWRTAISCLIESGLLDQLNCDRTQLERQISSLILATDITRQQEYLSQFKSYLDTNTLDLSKKEHRHLVLQIALKCADISNPCRSWEVSLKWSHNVCEEFFRQGDYERKLNLPVTTLCDRHTNTIPKIQTGFFQFVVTPLITEWHKFLQNDLSALMLENLRYNQRQWERLVAEDEAEETTTEISDADMVDDDLETNSGTISDSAELLLPSRHHSLVPPKQVGLKDQWRRFSVPLNVFNDSKFKNRDKTSKGPSPADAASCRGEGSMNVSAHSLHTQSVQERFTDDAAGDSNEIMLSKEKLLPDSSIASITTSHQATRLCTVLKEGSGGWRLFRQRTFPPLESATHDLSRRRHTSTYQHFADINKFKETALYKSVFRKEFDKTDKKDASVDVSECSRNLEKENLNPLIPQYTPNRRKSAPVGSQLRDNLTSVHVKSLNDQLMRRRKSVPTDTVSNAPKEKKMRDMSSVLPELLRRTLSGKEYCSHRRGSAPVPVASSELRGLDITGTVRHSINGGRRKANPISNQWLVKTTYTVHEKTMPLLIRRSSLPAEMFYPTDLVKSTELK